MCCYSTARLFQPADRSVDRHMTHAQTEHRTCVVLVKHVYHFETAGEICPDATAISLYKRKKKKHPVALRLWRQDVRRSATAPIQTRGPCLKECVSCLSLFVSVTGSELCCLWIFLPVPPLILCWAPTVQGTTLQSGQKERASFQTTVSCKEHINLQIFSQLAEVAHIPDLRLHVCI